MQFHKKFLLSFTLALSLCGLCLAHEGERIPGKYYDLHTDIPLSEARKVSAYMDQVFEAYKDRFAGHEIRNDDIAPVYLFSREADYYGFIRTDDTLGAVRSDGMFFYKDGKPTLAAHWKSDDADRLFSTLRHEAAHHFMVDKLGLMSLPRWLNEGIATYFDEGVLSGNVLLTGTISPYTLTRMQEAVRANQTIPFSKLFTSTESDWEKVVGSQDHFSDVYRQSSLVILFLNSWKRGRYSESFGDYFKRIGTGQTHEQAFPVAFGNATLEQLEKEWKEFVLSSRPSPASRARDELQFLARGLSALRQINIVPRTTAQLIEAMRRARLPVLAERSVFEDGLATLTLTAPNGPEPGGMLVRTHECNLQVYWVWGSNQYIPVIMGG